MMDFENTSSEANQGLSNEEYEQWMEHMVAEHEFNETHMSGMMGCGRVTFGNTYFGAMHFGAMILTWLALIAFLLAGARWFWKKSSDK